MEDSEIIISGPEFSGPEYWGSIAEYLIPKMKSHPKDFLIQVDLATNETITNEEFLKQSLEVAEGLIEFGLKQGEVVVFAAPHNIRGQVTAFGIIFSGGIFAPIDGNLKPIEFRNILRQLRPKYIICESAKGKEVRENSTAISLDPKIILIDSSVPNGDFSVWDEIRTKVDVDNYVPRKVGHPKDSIAIICSSSGSTGIPKGASISHYAVLFNLALTESLIIPAINKSFIHATPLYWISGILLLINSSYFGQTRCVPKSSSPEDLLEGIQKCKPFFLVLAPNILLSLVEHPDFKKYDVSSVNILFSAGGTLGQNVLEKIKNNWNDVAVSNVYGLTETFGGITLPSGSECTNAIGKLLPGFSVRVVDVSTGKSLGPHKIGECRIKTKRLMNGYYNNERDTKAAFDEKGWFRSGDLVYYDEEEIFYFVGRIKEVIQYQNCQIAPSELENFLLCLPGVKDVAIVPIPHEADDNHIRALVVKHPNSEVGAEDIVQAVKENFSSSKHLTAGVQFVDALPRTAVGKLRRLEVQKMVNLT